MSAIAAPQGQVVLMNTSWATYERLLTEHGEQCGTRFAFCDGELEIMVVSAEHEDLNRTLAALVELIASESDLDFVRRGSTTFKREDLAKGFEPDSCFYFRHARSLRGKPQIDLTADPPPELVIEIDIARSSLNRFPIYGAIGVEEVWRYAEGQVEMYTLAGRTYSKVQRSPSLPILTAEDATRLIAASQRETAPAWYRQVRAWIRSKGQ